MVEEGEANDWQGEEYLGLKRGVKRGGETGGGTVCEYSGNEVRFHV